MGEDWVRGCVGVGVFEDWCVGGGLGGVAGYLRLQGLSCISRSAAHPLALAHVDAHALKTRSLS